MIEVLIAVVLLALGLLSVALLQTNGVQNNYAAYQYTQSSIVAQSLSERMRANREAVVANAYQIDAAAPPPDPPVDCSTASCSAAQRAAWDLAVAYASVNRTATYTNVPDGPDGALPLGRLQVLCADAPCEDLSPRVITVFWDGSRSGASGLNCQPTDPDDLRCFRLVHIP